MKIEILYRPSYSMAKVALDSNENISVESGAMVGMSSNIKVETKMKGGLLKSLARSVLGGESFFINTYLASGGSRRINALPSVTGRCVYF